MYRVRIGRLDTRAEGGEPQKLGTNSLKFQWSEKGSQSGPGALRGRIFALGPELGPILSIECE